MSVMTVDYGTIPVDVKSFLDTHYKEGEFGLLETASQLYEAACDIAMASAMDEPLSEIHGKVMRACWFYCWNNVIDSQISICEMVDMDGFLTQKEKWHSARARMHGVTVYRGCSRREAEDDFDIPQNLGVSWTLNKNVAIEFARLRDGVVLTAVLDTLPQLFCGIKRYTRDIAVWLDTAESEVLWLNSHISKVSAERVNVYADVDTSVSNDFPLTPSQCKKKERSMNDETKRGRGRPRKHEDAKAAARAASAAYRERRKARREAPEVQSSIIDLSVLPAWKVKK